MLTVHTLQYLGDRVCDSDVPGVRVVRPGKDMLSLKLPIARD